LIKYPIENKREIIMSENKATQSKQETPKPNLALKKLEVLVGKWKLKGRTLNAKEDNITGELSGEWILDGFFLQLTGGISFQDFEVKSIEIIGYDAKKKIFPATVFGNSDGNPLQYQWNVEGNILTHSAAAGATYKGTISDDGKTISGGWRPDEGVKSNDGNTYDMTMDRAE